MKQIIRLTSCTKAANENEMTKKRVGQGLLKLALFFVMFFVAGSFSASAQQAKGSDEAQFAAKMDKAKWKKSGFGFTYPSFFVAREVFDDDIPTLYNTYSWRKVMLGYCSLGAWAVVDDNFPNEGQQLINKVKMKKITYYPRGKGVFSGFTNDGRIFYAKCKPTEGGMVTHLEVLALIYPKSYQKSVDVLIKQIASW
jgi:hypothetical protein